MVTGSSSARGRRPSIERLINALDPFEALPDREQPTVGDKREPF